MALQIDLSGKVALITGVSKGIGAGIASVMIEAGCHVSGCSRGKDDTPDLIRIREKAEKYNRSFSYQSVDVTRLSELEKLVKNTIDRFGKIDVLVSNAGVGIFEGLENCSEDRWQYNLDLNLNSHWRLSKLCKPYLELIPVSI